MPIDDRLSVLLRQATEDKDDVKSLQTRMIRIGRFALAALAAAKLQDWPAASQIVTTLLTLSPERIEERFFAMLEEVHDQLHRLQSRLDSLDYYESEPAQTILFLFLERLPTTHDPEKLERFGDAFANSGLPDFAVDDSENYARVLRDLSASDLRILTQESQRIERDQEAYPDNVLASLSQLAGMGLIYDTYTPIRDEEGGPLFKRSSVHYEASPFGRDFLRFISPASEASSTVSGIAPASD